jgi:hypothetical protein
VKYKEEISEIRNVYKISASKAAEKGSFNQRRE